MTNPTAPTGPPTGPPLAPLWAHSCDTALTRHDQLSYVSNHTFVRAHFSSTCGLCNLQCNAGSVSSAYCEVSSTLVCNVCRTRSVCTYIIISPSRESMYLFSRANFSVSEKCMREGHTLFNLNVLFFLRFLFVCA